MEDKVLRLIEEAMEADEGSLSRGQNLDWDSIEVLTFMSLADEHLGKTLAANRLKETLKYASIFDALVA
ncbi:acyl carrier protein [Pseudomonas triticifolii]|uniref:Acyl carrier protein n=1 Tax=Pseudomonas triticifolii TaxID=2762592 RepID=A0ABR7BD85_9PSED|nr:acyl carrier protein [Pseudomonas triticifolii]MBC3955146.1 acyl carrier protein [Pseudomonas triticifolii]